MALFYRLLDRLLRDLDAFRVERRKKRFRFCGEDVFISPKAVIWPESGLSIGRRCQIHSFTHIFAGGGVAIGDYTMISSCCSIASVTHPTENSCRREAAQIEKPVKIGKNVWIGTSAVILPGVTVGDNSVVGAGSVVTRDVPPCCIVVGNPAKVLRNLNKLT
jgi:maltose O-acetyltransferase